MKKEKEKERKAKYALYFAAFQEKKIQPLWPTNLDPPLQDLSLQAPASYVTKLG